MQRAIHLFLGAGIVAPLNRCRPRCYSSPSSLSGISRLPNPSKGRSFPPILPHPPRLTLRTPVLRPLSRRGSRSMTISADGSDSGQGHSADAAPTSSSGVATQKVQKPKASFCQSCGGPTNHIVPNGEEKLRAVCTVCGKIHYENPKMVVGCLVENEGKILLCKRNIEPSIGLWTLPAGYLEIGESAAEGAIRETLEEACADVEVLNPFAQLDIPLIGQSYIIFRARLRKPQFLPGPESSECAFFNLEDIPFDSLAFSSITVTLKLYIDDVKAGSFKFHYCTIMKRPGASPSDSRGFDLGCHLQS